MPALVLSEQQETKSAYNDTCGSWAVLSECAKGIHKFAKKIYCGREWCEHCGSHRSPAHNRKIARILPKIQQIKTMGYFVIEFPEWCRTLGRSGIKPDSKDDKFWCYSKKDLRDTTNSVVKILAGKRTGIKRRSGGYFKRGLLRWHWYGDKIPGKYNPHINVLVDGAYIDKRILNKIRNELRKELNIPTLIVNYSYMDQPGQMFHKAEYITRATFLNRSWDEYMAQEIYNFRNQRWWGSWNDEPVWNVTESDENESDLLKVAQLQKGICPCCNDGTKLKVRYNDRSGKPVKWTKPIDSAWLLTWNKKEYAGSGYYEILENDPGWYYSPENILTENDDDDSIRQSQAGIKIMECENDNRYTKK